MKKIGIVKWYGGVRKKPSGFLRNGVFLYKDYLLCKEDDLYESSCVTYQEEIYEEGNKKFAKDVQLISRDSDFGFFLSEINNEDEDILNAVQSRIVDALENSHSKTSESVLLELIEELGLSEYSSNEDILTFFNNQSNLKLLEAKPLTQYIDKLIILYMDNVDFLEMLIYTKLYRKYSSFSSINDLILNSLLNRAEQLYKVELIKKIIEIAPEEVLRPINNNSKFVEMLFEDQCSESESANYFSISNDKDFSILDDLISASEKEFVLYKPDHNFYSHLLYVKKATELYNTKKNTDILDLCLTNMEKYRPLHPLVKCFTDLIRLYKSGHPSHEAIFSSIGESIWNFLVEKQDLIKTNSHIIREYLKLVLPYCSNCYYHPTGLFREARYRKSRSEAIQKHDDYYSVPGREGKKSYIKTGSKETVTGEFNCRKNQCFHAETFNKLKEKQYYDYTIMDIISILGLHHYLKTSFYGDTEISTAILCGWINHLLEPKRFHHFFCADCGKLMRPTLEHNRESYLKDWARAGVYFTCEKGCLQNGDSWVYLSHCKNYFKCECIIDSREFKDACLNNHYYCPECKICNCEDEHIKWDEAEYKWIQIDSPFAKDFIPNERYKSRPWFIDKA